MANYRGKFVDESFSISGIPNTSIISGDSSMSYESSVASPYRRQIAAECRHSYNKSRDSAVSGLPRISTRKERPNDFGEDAEHFITQRNSTGRMTSLERHVSSPPYPIHSELAALECIPSPYKLQPNFDEMSQTYYPLHQGPRITVSSADGTSLWADGESDSQRNAAAQTLFRALERKNTAKKRQTLDTHLDKIFGSVDLDLEIMDMHVLNGVGVSENRFETQSVHGNMDGNNGVDISEGENGRKARSEVKKKRKWGGWFMKIFGLKRN
jgi:hypothetical protein